MSLTTLGGEALRALNVRLKAAGRTDLMADLRDGVNQSVKPLQGDIRTGVPEYMPSGYAPVLAKALQFRTTQRRGASAFTVSLSTIGRGSRKRREIRTLDRGVLRHPVYGRTRYLRWRVADGVRVRIPGGQPISNPWVAQRVRPGFWSDPVDKGKDEAIRKSAEVMHDVARRIAAG